MYICTYIMFIYICTFIVFNFRYRFLVYTFTVRSVRYSEVNSPIVYICFCWGISVGPLLGMCPQRFHCIMFTTRNELFFLLPFFVLKSSTNRLENETREIGSARVVYVCKTTTTTTTTMYLFFYFERQTDTQDGTGGRIYEHDFTVTRIHNGRIDGHLFSRKIEIVVLMRTRGSLFGKSTTDLRQQAA